jgi:hypothetical protein
MNPIRIRRVYRLLNNVLIGWSTLDNDQGDRIDP